MNTSDSLYLYAYCLTRAERLEAAYNLLKLKFLSSPEIRYLFAHCCYHLEKYGFRYVFVKYILLKCLQRNAFVYQVIEASIFYISVITKK